MPLNGAGVDVIQQVARLNREREIVAFAGVGATATEHSAHAHHAAAGPSVTAARPAATASEIRAVTAARSFS